IIARLAEAAGQQASLVVPRGETRVLFETFGTPPRDVRAIDAEVRAGGQLTLVTLQQGGDVNLAYRKVRLEDGATFRQFVLADGARFTRIETQVEVSGHDVSAEIDGVYTVAKGRHADVTSQVVLAAPGATVRQTVRGVARKGGRGVFQGRFLVERAAQKTDARMEHNALLLEEGAEVFAKPELEIYADDVQCAHGNTAGQLDEAAVFYLRQRGLPEAEARAMITRAFLLEVLPEWLEETTRD